VIRLGVGLVLWAALGATASASETSRPLSAIDWLEEALALPATPDPLPPLAPPPPEPVIEVSTLPPAGLGRVGLFAPSRIGLPEDLWASDSTEQVIAALQALPQDTLPSAQALTFRILLADFVPPAQGDAADLLVARIDKLVSMGALEQASLLVDAAPVQTAALNRRAFDIALLLGEEERACARLQGQIATDADAHAAQIFCLARRGEWQAAYTALKTARLLGELDPVAAELLDRFLDEEDAEILPPTPRDLTPLGWRILEALGDPAPTAALPLEFAHADLRGTSGWRAQLEAAERLTRAGVMQPNRLLGLYAQRRPAASGGVWERVRAVQALDRALGQRDPTAAAAAVQPAWSLFAQVELEIALAQMFAEPLAQLDLPQDAARFVWMLKVLDGDVSPRVQGLTPDRPSEQMVMALALGTDLPAGQGAGMAGAIASVWGGGGALNGDGTPADGSDGMRLLQALALLSEAANGDPHAAARALSSMRDIGQDIMARRIAIELLLLERRG
jgi:hypothetical protein